MTEKDMREMKAPWPKTILGLVRFIWKMLRQNDDYGKCVYAMSLSAVATFNYLSRKCGATGFQASCADMDILRRTRGYKAGFRIINYADLLYPQYIDEEHFPRPDKMLQDNIATLAPMARDLLKSPIGPMHPDVRSRLEMIAALRPEGGSHAD